MSEYYQKLRESGQDLCFDVTYQLNEDFAKYARQYRSEFVKSKTENDAREYITKLYCDALREVIEVKLVSNWTSFESDLNRTYQGD